MKQKSIFIYTLALSMFAVAAASFILLNIDTADAIFVDGYRLCDLPEWCTPSSLEGKTCNNGPTNTNSGGCGTACGVGERWTKYRYQCSRINFERCDYTLEPVAKVCSTADKYDNANRPVMRWGNCDCSVGNPYKVCCRDNDGDGVPETKVDARKLSVDTTNPPYEAVCPSGSKTLGPYVTSCPAPASKTYSISVGSSPVSGVSVGTSEGSGITSFSKSTTKSYDGNFNLSAPSSIPGYTFIRWVFDGTWIRTSPSTNISLNDTYPNRTASVEYTVVIPPPPPQCADGVDNDFDGSIDYPADKGCTSSSDNSEYLTPPSISLKATPSVISRGGSVTLSWSTGGDVSSCRASASPPQSDWNGSITPGNGSKSVTPVVNGFGSVTYTLTCSNPETSVSASTSVVVSYIRETSPN